MIFSISTSQVAGIIGMSHYPQPQDNLYENYRMALRILIWNTKEENMLSITFHITLIQSYT
jgi:type IV secretory pathway component VirB8